MNSPGEGQKEPNPKIRAGWGHSNLKSSKEKHSKKRMKGTSSAKQLKLYARAWIRRMGLFAVT
jgi:RNA:NAD 2'-phosphotransferase (TPT1/KptA family)